MSVADENLESADSLGAFEGKQRRSNGVMKTTDETTTLEVEIHDERFDGDGPVPLVIARRDPVTAPFRIAADEKKARIQQNSSLSEAQRRNALEMLCQQTEAEMRRALGERNFHAFKAFNQWWFRELGLGN
jgi:hypothetical protein